MEKTAPTTEKIVLSQEECRYSSEELFFQIINSHFSNIEFRTKIRLHENTITPIRHNILETERMDEQEFYDFALKRMIEEMEYLCKNCGYK